MLALLPGIETLDFMGCTNVAPKNVASLKRALAARPGVASCEVVAGKKLVVRYNRTGQRTPQRTAKAPSEADPFALSPPSSPFGMSSPLFSSFGGLSPVLARKVAQKDGVRKADGQGEDTPVKSNGNAPAANAFEGDLWSCDQFITFLRKGMRATAHCRDVSI
jgi:hypothetical protein